MYRTANCSFRGEIWLAPTNWSAPRARRSRRWRAAICGCTSRGWGRTTTQHEIPIITRGEGCYVYDEHGKRYLDGLSSLFCVNIGHGRADIAQAGADQAKDLGFFTNWSYAHPRAIELAARIADLAPGDLNRVFFTSGGSEAVESAIKLARQYHKVTGNPQKTKIIAREIAYHGTTLGALAATGISSLKNPFEPVTPGGYHVPNTNTFRMPHGLTPVAAGGHGRREDRVPRA